MFDDLERLRENPHLVELLAHYANLGKQDRSVWQQRLMEMEGIDSKELSKLHGDLIAFDWIEQNPGRDSTTGGILASLYRVTSQGVRDICHIQGIECSERPEVPEKVTPRFPSRKKKQKVEAAEAVSALPQIDDVISPSMSSTSA